LFAILPALSLAAGLVSLRALHLRLHGKWAFLQSGIVALVVGEVASALHYWPLSPVAYGLGVLGPAYALTSLLGGVAEGEPFGQAIIEPGIVLAVVWGAAFWLR
jgi:hypothetical protein